MGGEGKPAMDKHKELLATLQEMLLPDPEVKKKKAGDLARAQKIIEEEFNRGPFQVQGMVYQRKGTKAGLYWHLPKQHYL